MQTQAIEDPREIEKEMDQTSVISLGDIYRALKAHPQWALELRRVLLSADLLELPARFEEFAKEVKEQFKKIDERFEQVDKRFEQVEERLDRLEKDVEELKRDVAQLKIDVADLKGDNFERKVRERAHAYFGRFFLKVKVIPGETWLEVLDEAVSQGIITWEERNYALDLDVLIRCRKKEEPRELLLAVEASVSAYEKDAERALKRAEIFSKVFQMETIPVVIAQEIPSEFEKKFSLVVFINVSKR